MIDQDTIDKLKDPYWRINNLYKITDKRGSIVPFKMNAGQEHFYRASTNRDIVLKSRQLGFSTLEAIRALDSILFNPNYRAYMISMTLASATDLFDKKIKFAWENLEEWQALYKIEKKDANTLRVNFGDGSTSEIQTGTTARSGTFQTIHISELASVSRHDPIKAAEIVKGAFPAAQEGRICIESTAEGETGEFYDIFWNAFNSEKQTKEDFKAHFYNWQWDKEGIEGSTVIPTDQMEEPVYFTNYKKKFNLSDKEISYYYSKWRLLKKNWNDLRQEYPTTPEEAFAVSGDKIVNADAITKLDKIEPIETINNWKIYKAFDPSHRYALGADVAEGVNKDSSTGVVWDFTTSEVVATYKNNTIDPENFAHTLVQGGNLYGTCLIAVERNNHGHAVIVVLKNNYPTDKIYKQKKKDKVNENYTEQLGWLTSSVTKPRMVHGLANAINNGEVQLNDKSLIMEARTYDKIDNKISSNTTRHFDLWIAACIGFEMASEVFEDLPILDEEYEPWTEYGI
jgi:hypothetical protein